MPSTTDPPVGVTQVFIAASASTTSFARDRRNVTFRPSRKLSGTSGAISARSVMICSAMWMPRSVSSPASVIARRNWAGASTVPSGCGQRASASAPVMRPESMSTTGW